MRHAAFSLIVLGALSIPGRADAQTPFSVDARVGNFHVAVANYYHVPEREVVVIRERRVRDEDLPVVLFIAQQVLGTPQIEFIKVTHNVPYENQRTYQQFVCANL